MLYLGIDLGGTNIKTAVVDENYNILSMASRPTNLPRPAEAVCDDIILSMDEVLKEAGSSYDAVGGIGIGCPGNVNPHTGIVVYSNNLDWHNFPMVEYIRSRTGCEVVRIGNDANVAALGEAVAGCAKGAQSAVIITLGTGVGSGVVLDGQILTGFGGGASEIGHIVIADGGPLCTCGRRGCFEVYSSATGLIRLTKEAMAKNPGSMLDTLAAERGKVSGRTAFDAMRAGDATGKAVVEEYIHYLACGLTNVMNIFQPEVIALSGGISNEGDTLMVPLREQVEKEMYGGPGQNPTRFEICSLGYRAGLIGAAELAK